MTSARGGAVAASARSPFDGIWDVVGENGAAAIQVAGDKATAIAGPGKGDQATIQVAGAEVTLRWPDGTFYFTLAGWTSAPTGAPRMELRRWTDQSGSEQKAFHEVWTRREVPQNIKDLFPTIGDKELYDAYLVDGDNVTGLAGRLGVPTLQKATAAQRERARAPLRKTVWTIGALEFIGVPFFMYLGFERLDIIGAVIMYMSYVGSFFLSIAAIKQAALVSIAFEAALQKLSTKTFKRPIVKLSLFLQGMWTPLAKRPHEQFAKAGFNISEASLPHDTGIPVMLISFLTTIPALTDNWALGLAIAGAQRTWNRNSNMLQHAWIITWHDVPYMKFLAAAVTLPAVLMLLIGFGLAIHLYYFVLHMNSGNLVGAARVCNINVLADMVEESEREEESLSTPEPVTHASPADRPSSVTKSEHVEGEQTHSTGSGPASSSVGDIEALAEPLLTKTGADIEANSSSHSVDSIKQDLSNVDMKVDAKTFEQNRLSALRTRFLAKVVCGCSLRLWFKVSLQVLLSILGLPGTEMLVLSIITGLMHVLQGTLPYASALLDARHMGHRKCGHLAFMCFVLAPVFMSFVRMCGIRLCVSGVFSFSSGGCVPLANFGSCHARPIVAYCLDSTITAYCATLGMAHCNQQFVCDWIWPV